MDQDVPAPDKASHRATMSPMASDAERIKQQVCSSWSRDRDYRGEGARFLCQCGAMTGVYPDHESGEAELDRHLDAEEERFHRLIGAHEPPRRRWLRFFRRAGRWEVV